MHTCGQGSLTSTGREETHLLRFSPGRQSAGWMPACVNRDPLSEKATPRSVRSDLAKQGRRQHILPVLRTTHNGLTDALTRKRLSSQALRVNHAEQGHHGQEAGWGWQGQARRRGGRLLIGTGSPFGVARMLGDGGYTTSRGRRMSLDCLLRNDQFWFA